MFNVEEKKYLTKPEILVIHFHQHHTETFIVWQSKHTVGIHSFIAIWKHNIVVNASSIWTKMIKWNICQIMDESWFHHLNNNIRW